MSGEIREAKERVRELTEALRTARPNERVRVGVVAYKDKRDSYLTRVSPLSEDVEVSYQFLATLSADGGGDTPEDVLAGLTAALRELKWDLGPDTERQVFIIADAPPHLGYSDRPKPEALIARDLTDPGRGPSRPLGSSPHPPHGFYPAYARSSPATR